MKLGRRTYSGLHKIVEDDKDSSNSLDRIPSRPSTNDRRATVDGIRLLHRPASSERRFTLDSVRALSPMKYSLGNPQQGARYDPPERWDKEDSHTPRSTPDSAKGQLRENERDESVESDASTVKYIYPGVRSQSVPDPRELSETEKRYLASLDQRRDGLDTAMLQSIGAGHKTGRGETGRWSLPTALGGGNNMRTASFCSNASDQMHPKTPKTITRLKREDSFGTREELYKVDMDDGLTYVCRKRANSVTNPDLMTEDERRIHEFLQGAARLSQKNNSFSSNSSTDDRFHRSHRIYSLGESKLVVDPVMSKLAARTQSKKQRKKNKLERRVSHPISLLLPPIFRQEAFIPYERDFSIPTGPRTTPEFTDDVVEELSHCRYLRPPPRKFQDPPEDIAEED